MSLQFSQQCFTLSRISDDKAPILLLRTRVVNMSSLERLTLFCYIHFFLVPTIQQNRYLLDVKKSRRKPLSFVKYIITNPYPTLIPRQSGKCHLPSPIYCESLNHLWGKEEGTSSWDWIAHLSSMGTKWQRQCQMTNVLESSFSFYYVILINPLTIEWSKL